MHLTTNLTGIGYLEKRRLAAMQTHQEEPPTFVGIPAISWRGSTITLLDRKSWASLFAATDDATGEVRYFVAVPQTTPMSLRLFGRNRVWPAANLTDARKKLFQVAGQFV